MDDRTIRKILVSTLKARKSKIRIFHEKSIGGSICDIMAVTDCLTGYEIKSDLDNYTRIESQIKWYDRFFNYNYIVVGESHAKSVESKVPDYWGIIVIRANGVEFVRSPVENKKMIIEKQLSILWKLELKNLLNRFGLPMYALRSKEYIINQLKDRVPHKQLSSQVAIELMNRDYSVYNAEDYTEYYENKEKVLSDYHKIELMDQVSEMDVGQMTLDQWIDIYRKAKEVREIREGIERKPVSRPKHKINYEDIEVTPGAPWISVAIINEFIGFLTENALSRYVKANYEPITGNWFIQQKRDADRVPNCTVKYGLKRYNALFILEAALNLREIKLYDSEHKYDERSTLAAIEKQRMILDLFSEWVWEDEDRIWEIEEAYNKLFSGYSKEHYDGSKLEFDGMEPTFELFDYQKDAVQRIISTDNTLLAFDVGAGKTFIMIAAAMKMRQEGVSRKNMFVVPNNIVGQWEKIFSELYPAARLLVIDPKNFKRPVRDKAMEQMRDGDYDGIIIAYSCFEQIPISSSYITEQMNKKVDEISAAIAKVPLESGSQSSLYNLEKSILKSSYELIQSMHNKTDSITFDDLEINTLFLDEAHNYKNIPIKTKMRNIRGINTRGSSKCTDMLYKVRMIQSTNNGRGVVFATGTPLCNSLTDVYTMQMYLQYDKMVETRLEVFDNWVKTFARPEKIAEIDVDTHHYRLVTRFSKFFNLPELSKMFSEIAIFHAMSDKNGIPIMDEYRDIIIKRNDALSEYMIELADRTELIRSGKIDKSFDNMLKVSTDGRKAALDLRLVYKEQPEDTSKVIECVKNVKNVYDKYGGCSQIVFCDYSTPKNADFNVYNVVRDKLVELGIPKKEIAFIHSYHNEEKKVELYRKVNEGEVRLLLGSTFKLGIGANVQTRLIAVHHLDVPWRPADVGRILRTFKIKKNVEVTDNGKDNF